MKYIRIFSHILFRKKFNKTVLIFEKTSKITTYPDKYICVSIGDHLQDGGGFKRVLTI